MLNRIASSLILFGALSVSAQQYPGKTSYSLKNSTSSNLIDTNGTVTHSWIHASNAPTCYSTYVMPGGVLWRTVTKSGNSFSGGPISGQFQKINYSGNLLWDFVYSTTGYCSHHDICPMPNGNVLLIAYEARTQAEVTAAGCTGYTGIMWPDKIVEVQQTGPNSGTVVWEWKAWDHLVQNVNPNASNYQTSIVNHPELFNINYRPQRDWMHVNGVNYNPILDQIAISSHNLNEIYVIDHSTTTAEAAGHAGGNSGKGGDILYRWGNPAAYSASGTAVFNVVHDAHWVPEGCPNAGDLAGYNNRGISSTASCADIFTPSVSGYNYPIIPGSAFTPASYTIRQACGGYNGNEGSSQQLPNGNIL
ncbi:MAG: aryl-sulfate sulfotransferase, partial [Bacteroidota bacterium]